MRHWISPWYASNAAVGFAVPGLAAIIIPLIVVRTGHEPIRVAAVVAAQNWGVLLAPVWGWLADRERVRPAVLFAGLLCIAAGFAGLASTRSLWLLLGASFAIGTGTGAFNTTAIILITRFRPVCEWGPRLAWLQTFGAIGTTAGLGAAGLIAPRTGAAVAMVLMLAAAPMAMANVNSPLMRTLKDRRPGPAAQVIDPDRAPGFALFLAAWFFLSLAVSVFASLYPITMQQSFGVSVRASSSAVAAATLVSLPLCMGAGVLVARLGSARVLLLGLLFRFGALLGLVLIGLAHAGPWLPAILLAALFQAVWPLLGVASNDLAASLAPFGRGVAIGVFNAVGALSSGIGALLAGLMAELFGYQHVIGLAAGMALVAVLLGLGLLRSHRRAMQPIVLA